MVDHRHDGEIRIVDDAVEVAGAVVAHCDAEGLAALEHVTFPRNTNRKNVKKNHDRNEYMESFCLGGVFSWAKRSSYGC